jgi:hypothetical protein
MKMNDMSHPNTKTSEETFISDLSKEVFPIAQKVEARSVSDNILKFIQQENPEINDDSSLAISELSAYRVKYISSKLQGQMGELSSLEKMVIDTLSNGTQISNLAVSQDNTPLSVGQRMADKVASFGGSWTFIISFGFFLFVWISINTAFLMNKGFDPPDFIVYRRATSADYHDESKPTRGKRPRTLEIRLHDQLEIRIRNPHLT